MINKKLWYGKGKDETEKELIKYLQYILFVQKYFITDVQNCIIIHSNKEYPTKNTNVLSIKNCRMKHEKQNFFIEKVTLLHHCL